MKQAFWSTTLCAVALTAGLLWGCGATSGSASGSAATSASATSSSSASTSNSASGSTSNSASTSASTSSTTTTEVKMPTEVPEDSILRFDKSDGAQKLLANIEEGKLPTSCTVLYDQMGSLPSVDVTDEATIAQIVGLVSQMRVLGPSNTSITDNYHSVYFTLQDGTKAGYHFEGAGNVVLKDGNCFVDGDAPLWALVRQLQGVKDTGNHEHAIGLLDEYEVVESCPTSAVAGETVRITTYDVTDVETVVRVTGTEVTRRGMYWDFVMPDYDVLVQVTLEAYEFGGGA